MAKQGRKAGYPKVTLNNEETCANSPHSLDTEFRGAFALDERYAERGRNSPTRGPVSEVTQKKKRARKTPVYSLTKIRRRGMYGY